jgi:septum formation protein
VGPRFILASGSPRRRQLLGEAGYEFEVLSAPVDEVAHGWLTIRELTIWNAARKAARVSGMAPDAVVLAAER